MVNVIKITNHITPADAQTLMANKTSKFLKLVDLMTYKR